MTSAKTSQSKNIDDLYRSLGVWGRYQLLQFILLKLLAWPASNQLFSIWYIGYQPPLRCALSSNTSQIRGTISTVNNESLGRPFYATCRGLLENNNGTSCNNGYEYDKEPAAFTTTTEWDLVCDRSYQAQLAQTILILGQAVGASLFTMLADRFGRKPICLLAQWGMLITGVALAFSPNLVIYLVLRFTIGAFQQGHVTMTMVIPMELLTIDHRAKVHLLGGFFWQGSMLILSAIGYGFQDLSWRHCQLAITASSLIILVPHMFLLDESIRWLFANGRNEEAFALISKACRWNKADEAEVMEKAKACIMKSDSLEKQLHVDEKPNEGGISANKAVVQYTEIPWQRQTKYSFIDVWRSPKLRITSFVMFFGWINTAFTAFGLILTTHRLAGDRHLNYFLLTITAIPPSIISYFTMTRIGRRATVVAFTAATGLALLTTVILQTFVGESMSTLVTALTILGTNTIGCVFGTLFQYTPELFPTNLRSVGVGIASTASRIGGMVGPFSNLLIEYYQWAPGTLYGCMSVIVSFLYMLLPETVDKALPQTIEEINKWKKNKARPKKKTTNLHKSSAPI